MNITAYVDGNGKGIIEGDFNDVYNHSAVVNLIRKAIDDVADRVEEEARDYVPKGPTGKLKEHPVDREDTRVEIIPDYYSPGFGTQTSIPLFGGGSAVRGPGGRFVKPEAFSPSVYMPGGIIAKSVITLPEKPHYAVWVHEGTGIHGPRGQMITARNNDYMKFPAHRWPSASFRRANYRFKEVKGQEANPYLLKAFLYVDNSYVPMRLKELDAEIASVT